MRPRTAPPRPRAVRAACRAALIRFGGLSAYHALRVVYSAERWARPHPLTSAARTPSRGFTGTTLATASRHLDQLAATLARGKTRTRAKAEAEIATITRGAWVRRAITWQLTGDAPYDLRLAWNNDEHAHTALEPGIFGKHVLITSHHD